MDLHNCVFADTERLSRNHSLLTQNGSRILREIRLVGNVITSIIIYFKLDIKYSAADLVFGTTLLLPGEFSTPHSPAPLVVQTCTTLLSAYKRNLPSAQTPFTTIELEASPHVQLVIWLCEYWYWLTDLLGFRPGLFLLLSFPDLSLNPLDDHGSSACWIWIYGEYFVCRQPHQLYETPFWVIPRHG